MNILFHLKGKNMLTRRDFGIGVAATALSVIGCEAGESRITNITKYLHVSEVGWFHFGFDREKDNGLKLCKVPGINPYSPYYSYGYYFSNGIIYDITSIPEYMEEKISPANIIRITGFNYLEKVLFSTNEDLSRPSKISKPIPFNTRFPNFNNDIRKDGYIQYRTIS